MDEDSCVKLLEEHQIKPTANRIVVVKALATSIQPQSLAELERKICTIWSMRLKATATAQGMSSVTAIAMNMMTTSIHISTVSSVSRPTVSTMQKCLMSNYQRDLWPLRRT